MSAGLMPDRICAVAVTAMVANAMIVNTFLFIFSMLNAQCLMLNA
jgi:hypothetical protein